MLQRIGIVTNGVLPTGWGKRWNRNQLRFLGSRARQRQPPGGTSALDADIPAVFQADDSASFISGVPGVSVRVNERGDHVVYLDASPDRETNGGAKLSA